MDSHIAKHLLLDSDVVNPYQITLNDVHASERFSVTTADIRYNVYIVFTASFDIRFSDSDKTPVNASGSLISDLNLRGPDVDCGSAVVYNDNIIPRKELIHANLTHTDYMFTPNLNYNHKQDEDFITKKIVGMRGQITFKMEENHAKVFIVDSKQFYFIPGVYNDSVQV
jgi:hypothetical protein